MTGLVERALQHVRNAYGGDDVPLVSLTFDGVTVYDPMRLAMCSELPDYDTDVEYVLSDFSDVASDAWSDDSFNEYP